MFRKNSDPLLVYVHDNRYDCFGDANTFRSNFLFQVLTRMGGINESVEPGFYHFNLKRVGLKFVASLDPVES